MAVLSRSGRPVWASVLITVFAVVLSPMQLVVAVVDFVHGDLAAASSDGTRLAAYLALAIALDARFPPAKRRRRVDLDA